MNQITSSQPCIEAEPTPGDFQGVPSRPGSQLPPYEQTDQEIKAMFGVSLPKKSRLSAKREDELLSRVRKAPPEERDFEAEEEYLSYRVRTVYNAVKNIPEDNGLTIEDYFQIGCKTVLAEASGEKLANIDYSTTIYLYNEVRGAIRDTRRNMHFAGTGRKVAEIDNAEEQEEIIPYKDEEIASSSKGPYEEVEKAEEIEIIENAVKSFPEDYIRVAELKYGLKLTEGEEEHPDTEPTLSSIAEELDVTRERIRQIDERVLRALAQNSNIISRKNSVIADRLRDRTPVVIADDPHEQRVARRLGYEVCDELILKVLDDLEAGIYYSGAPPMSRISSRQLLTGRPEEIAEKAALIRKITGIQGAMDIEASETTEIPSPHTHHARAIDVKHKINRRLTTPDQIW